MRWRIAILATRVVGAAAVAAGAPHFEVRGLADEPKPLFEDRFDEKLADGWSFIARNEKAWRMREGALEIRNLPAAENVPARDLPPPIHGPYAVEVTLTSVQPPSEQYEQAGLGWYLDGKLAFKFVKERIDGKVYVFPGKKEMDAATVQLRLVVRAGKVTAQYRPDAKGDFQTAFAADAPQSGKARAQIGLMCFHGPKDSEHWIRFDDFRIVRLSE